MKTTSRRNFMKYAAAGAGRPASCRRPSRRRRKKKPIQGFEKTDSNTRTDKAWEPVSDRRIRVGIVGYGLMQIRRGLWIPGPIQCRKL